MFAVGFIIIIVFIIIIKRPCIGVNEPPLVPYTIPILGHTFDYLFNMKNFLKKCKEQYGDCFSIYVFGYVWTIVTRQFTSEMLKSQDDFDSAAALNEFLPFNRIFIYNGGTTKESSKFHAKTVREQISGKLESNIRIVQKYLVKGIDKWIGDCNDPKTYYNAWPIINNIIALPIANIFVGEEAASHEDLVKSFGDLALDLGPLMTIPPIFAFIHKKVHQFVISIPSRFGWNPVSRHRKVLINRLKPVIEKRLEEKITNGDNYKPYDDLLEYYMNQSDFDYTKPNNLLYHIDNLFIMIFGAIVTTSRAAANVLYDFAGRPEYFNELYEEALKINKECNGSLTVSDIRKMEKLDSFVKESFRHTDDIVANPHYTISESYTFSNGLTIPKGRMVLIYIDDSLKSKEAYGEDAEEFRPFRFVNEDSPATKVDNSFIMFGGGKHACPGRFFAVNEIKLILHELMLKYNILTKSGKVENKLVIGPFTAPSRSALIFENRK